MKGVEANMNKYIIMLFTTTADITLTYMAPDNLCTVAGCFSTKFLACFMHGNCKGKNCLCQTPDIWKFQFIIAWLTMFHNFESTLNQSGSGIVSAAEDSSTEYSVLLVMH